MTPAERVARELSEDLSRRLHRLGIFCRVFARAKSLDSLRRKMEAKQYTAERRLQDLIGLRVTVYFADDVELVHGLLRSAYANFFVGETVDRLDSDTFGPVRVNLVFRLDEGHRSLMERALEDQRIDSTFEVQVRTVLSEGWHEVEHDLRYKCSSDWDHQDDLNRALNGILASLETSDWSMMQLFERLSHRHYKQGNWAAMMRTKFRLRMTPSPVDGKVFQALSERPELAKAIFRVERVGLVSALARSSLDMPFTYSNVVFLADHLVLRHPVLRDVVPSAIGELLEEHLPPAAAHDLAGVE